MKNPCHHCEEREPGCHGKCEKYKAWADERDRLREIATRERILNLHLDEEPFRAIKRSRNIKKRR